MTGHAIYINIHNTDSNKIEYMSHFCQSKPEFSTKALILLSSSALVGGTESCNLLLDCPDVLQGVVAYILLPNSSSNSEASNAG